MKVLLKSLNSIIYFCSLVLMARVNHKIKSRKLRKDAAIFQCLKLKRITRKLVTLNAKLTKIDLAAMENVTGEYQEYFFLKHRIVTVS